MHHAATRFPSKADHVGDVVLVLRVAASRLSAELGLEKQNSPELISRMARSLSVASFCSTMRSSLPPASRTIGRSRSDVEHGSENRGDRLLAVVIGKKSRMVRGRRPGTSPFICHHRAAVSRQRGLGLHHPAWPATSCSGARRPLHLRARRLDALGLVAGDHHNGRCADRLDPSMTCTTMGRPPGMEHLGQVGLHALSHARGENDGGNLCRIVLLYPETVTDVGARQAQQLV